MSAPPDSWRSDRDRADDARRGSRLLRGIVMLPSLALIGGVRLYQIFLGPFFGGRCRFHPSCSHYFIEAVRKYGTVSGAARGVWRILRCHPWNPGGEDPP